jgi:hypothetical protein
LAGQEAHRQKAKGHGLQAAPTTTNVQIAPAAFWRPSSRALTSSLNTTPMTMPYR